ncbi:MAG: hypothetical protein QXD62_02055 [Candidatus Woesearchaeota archaeon]
MNEISLLKLALKYYSKVEVQEAICRESENREVGLMLISGEYLNRPEKITNPREIFEYAKKKVVSFHFSEELWKDPLQIGKISNDELRIGWDFILDVDGFNLEISKLATLRFLQFLDQYEISYGIKFSGNKGFHIGIPFECLPSEINEKPIQLLFPESARKVSSFINMKVSKKIEEDILKNYSVEDLTKMTGKSYERLISNGSLKVSELVSIDTQLVSSRHLFRAPYSLNEKSGLVSVVISKQQFKNFERELAKPENVDTELWFINRKNAIKGSAKKLFITSLDYFSNDIFTNDKVIKEKEESKRLEINPQISEKVRESLLSSEPPCIRKIKEGLKDGRKRSLFIYLNYLHSLNFSKEEIEKIILEWNKKNQPPLKDSYLNGQIKYFLKREPLKPPNCNKEGFYKDINICFPDKVCETIKNPLNYTLKIVKRKIMLEKEKKRKK